MYVNEEIFESIHNLTGDLVKTSPFNFHSPGTSSSDISVSNMASSFSVTSTLASGFRMSASRSEKRFAFVLRNIKTAH